MTDGLAAFLAERLDEAEAVARAASSDDAPAGDTWHQDDPDRRPGLISDQRGDVVVYDEGSPIEVQAEHIAANDPARTLRAIAAKRAILADCTAKLRYPANAPMYNLAVRTLRNLAGEWADHPAYLPAWAPQPGTALRPESSPATIPPVMPRLTPT